MDKQKKRYVIALVALVVAVWWLAIGFSAFSSVLSVQPQASVNPSDAAFNVDFSSSNLSIVTDNVVPVKTPTTITATEAVIDNTSNPVISNLSAVFTEPGQKAVYTFYAYNTGQYLAYLKNITYSNVNGETSFRKCVAQTGTTDALVQTACNDIVVKVKVGSEAEVIGSKSGITGHSLAENTSEQIIVTIEYLAGGSRADGDFVVDFGDITLNYSSVD